MLKFFLVAHPTYENHWGKWHSKIPTLGFFGTPYLWWIVLRLDCTGSGCLMCKVVQGQPVCGGRGSLRGANGRRQRCNCMQMPVFCPTGHKTEDTASWPKKYWGKRFLLQDSGFLFCTDLHAWYDIEKAASRLVILEDLMATVLAWDADIILTAGLDVNGINDVGVRISCAGIWI